MNSENAPSSIDLVTFDQIFNAFNGNGRWLKGSIDKFLEDEDAELVFSTPQWVGDYLNDDDFYIDINSKSSAYGNRLKISFSAYGFRRGVLLMDSMFLDWPHQQTETSNWYLGFTVAGNGTPAFIFPVNDDLSRTFASVVLKRALL